MLVRFTENKNLGFDFNPFKTVNSYIIDYLINNGKILSSQKSAYAGKITDTVFKFYYLWIYTNNSYFGMKDKITPTTTGYQIASFIAQKSQINVMVCNYTLQAIYGLCMAGVFPNNWLNPTQASAKALYDKLELNPTSLGNFIDVVLNLVKPIGTVITDTAGKLGDSWGMPIVAVAAVVGFFLIKPYISK